MRIINFEDGFTSATAPATEMAASGVSVTPTGNLGSSNVQAALVELQGDINTINSGIGGDLTTHMAATAAHGATGAVVGTTNTQALTNKTLVVASNTITTAASGNLGATELNAALAELQADIDTRATASALSAHEAASSVHGVTGNVVGTGGAQTLTDKVLTSPRIDGYVDVDEESAPSSPSAGIIRVFAKSDKKLWTKNSDGVEQEIGSGTGQGELNLMTNPSGATNTTGYTASGSGSPTVTRVSTGGPLDPIIPTALRLDAGSAGAYIEGTFTVPDALANTKLKVQFHQEPESGAATGEWKLEVYKGSDEYPLSTDVSGTSSIPALTGKYTSYFDTGAAGTDYKVRWVRVTGSNHLDVTSVIIGPGIQPQGAVVEEWLSYSPTMSWISGINWSGRYRRVGNSMEVMILGEATGAVTATDLTATVPASLTIDTTQLPTNTSANELALGTINLLDSGTGNYSGQVVYGSTTTVLATYTGTGNSGYVNASFPIGTWASGDRVGMRFTVPIAEWAGSGTLNVAQNDVAYVSHNGTTAVYGPSGALIPSGTPASSVEDYSITAALAALGFQPDTDKLTMEFQTSGQGSWSEVTTSYAVLRYDGTNFVGAGVGNRGSATDTYMTKGKYANGLTDTWGTPTTRWRVRVIKGGAATVGVGTATTTAAGHVKVPSHADNGSTQATYAAANPLDLIVRSGRYTPTASNTANLDATPTANANSMIWTQIGRVVTCSGFIAVNPTTNTTATSFRLTLPVARATNFSSGEEASGGGSHQSSGTGSTAVVATATAVSGTKLVEIGFIAQDTSASRNCFYWFQYIVD